LENRCPRLSTEEYDELDARALLLLRSATDGRPLPTVACDEQTAWVEWAGRRWDLPGIEPIADEVLDVLDATLRAEEAAARRQAAEPPPERSRRARPASATATEPALVESPKVRAARVARGGGLAVGMETELTNGIGPVIGPACDFASSVGPLLLGAREAFRFAINAREASLLDFQLSLGYGAPLKPGAPLGIVARLGGECLVASPQGGRVQAACVPSADLGGRAARSAGAFSVWVGFDARIRITPLQLGLRDPAVVGDVSGSFTVGVAFVDWSRK
jgi:hypothetical protein